jgi:hypothetical protein
MPVDQFTFQTGKKTFSHRIVIGITHTTHGGANSHFLASLAELNAGVLTALDALLKVKRQFVCY